VTKPDSGSEAIEPVCGKNLKKQTRESLECCKASLTDDSGGCSEDQNTDRNVDSKDQANRFQLEMKTLLGIRLEALHVAFQQRICLHFVSVLRL
jgi:hypothetical protein